MPISPDPLTEERNWLAQEAYLGDAAHALGCPTAWDTTLGVRSVYVCVVSSVGVALAHPDLIKNPNSNLGIVVAAGIPGPLIGSPSAAETAAANAYGTAVAGVAAANWSIPPGLPANGRVIGVAPGASIYSLRTGDHNPSSLAAALDTLVAENFATATAAPPAIPAPANPGGGPAFPAASYPTLRRIALLPVPNVLPAPPNNVWTPAQLTSLTTAIDAHQVVVVVATGQDAANAGSAIQDDIAERSDVIVVGANAIVAGDVGAVDRSRTGPSVCVTARGAEVVVADLIGAAGINAAAGDAGNAATTFSDTTAAAAAQAAGVAALVLSANSRLKPLDVRRILRESCEGSAGPHSNSLGYGQLRADLAVAKAIARRADVAVLGSGLALECNFGSVEVGGQVDAIIEFRNAVPTSLSPVTYSVGPLPANVAAVVSAGFENPAALLTVSAGAPKQIRLRLTAPSSTGSVTQTLHIDSDDDRIIGTAASFAITVRYDVVPIRVVDTVLALDRSGSMSGAADGGSLRKVDVVIQAAKLYADKLRNGDRLGIVSFDHLTEVLLSGTSSSGLVLAGDPATTSMRAHLKARLTDTAADLGPRGSTSIGGGILAGDTLLDSQAPEPSTTRVLFVFTDGLHNSGAAVATGLAQVPIKPVSSWEDTRLFAVRAGLASNTAGDGFFESLTSVAAGGWAANVDADLFMIEKLFIRVIAEASDFSLPVDPEYRLAPGEKASTTIPLGDVDSEADFVVLYRASAAFPKYLRIWLEEPNGAVHHFQDIVAGTVPGISAIFDTGHVILRCKLPRRAVEPRAHVGLWKVWVQNALQIVDIQDRRRVGGEEALSCAVTATVKSNLRLKGRITQPAYTPGTPITVTLEPSGYGLALELAAPPDVRVVRPDGVAFAVAVARTPQGSYVGNVTDTGLLGTYQLTATVKVQTPGVLLSRDWAGSALIRPVAPLVPSPAQQAAEATKESLVKLPDPPGGGHGHDPHDPRHPHDDCHHHHHCRHCGTHHHCSHHHHHGHHHLCAQSLLHKLASLLKL